MSIQSDDVECPGRLVKDDQLPRHLKSAGALHRPVCFWISHEEELLGFALKLQLQAPLRYIASSLTFTPSLLPI